MVPWRKQDAATHIGPDETVTYLGSSSYKQSMNKASPSLNKIGMGQYQKCVDWGVAYAKLF